MKWKDKLGKPKAFKKEINESIKCWKSLVADPNSVGLFSWVELNSQNLHYDSFIQRISSRQDNISLVRYTLGDRACWYYVQVDPLKKVQFYENMSRTRPLNLSDYGEVLFSGWGKDPPKDIVKKVEELDS